MWQQFIRIYRIVLKSKELIEKNLEEKSERHLLCENLCQMSLFFSRTRVSFLGIFQGKLSIGLDFQSLPLSHFPSPLSLLNFAAFVTNDKLKSLTKYFFSSIQGKGFPSKDFLSLLFAHKSICHWILIFFSVFRIFSFTILLLILILTLFSEFFLNFPKFKLAFLFSFLFSFDKLLLSFSITFKFKDNESFAVIYIDGRQLLLSVQFFFLFFGGWKNVLID